MTLTPDLLAYLRRMFSGLRSAWMILHLCRKWIELRICSTNLLIKSRGSPQYPLLFTSSYKFIDSRSKVMHCVTLTNNYDTISPHETFFELDAVFGGTGVLFLDQTQNADFRLGLFCVFVIVLDDFERNQLLVFITQKVLLLQSQHLKTSPKEPYPRFYTTSYRYMIWSPFSKGYCSCLLIVLISLLVNRFCLQFCPQ